MKNKKVLIRRAFTIKYRVNDYFSIKSLFDLMLLGIANIKDNDGYTALMAASYTGNKDMVELLIQAGVNINDKNYWLETALMLALDDVISGFLIKAGASLDEKDNEGRTALMIASSSSMKEGEAIVRLLIQAGASINEKNKDGMTALMMASAKKVVDLLKQAGAE